jgi:hypothetical protein
LIYSTSPLLCLLGGTVSVWSPVPQGLGWLERNSGKVCASQCVCAHGELVCGTPKGTRWPSPPRRAGRNLGSKEGIETHHEIRVRVWEEIPCTPASPRFPCAAELALPELRSCLLHELRVSPRTPGSFSAPFLTAKCFSAPWAAAPQSQALGQLASRCLLLWLAQDSLHTPTSFLPQRARGTDPEQVLEGTGVSQALRGVWGRDGELRLPWSLLRGKPLPYGTALSPSCRKRVGPLHW